MGTLSRNLTRWNRGVGLSVLGLIAKANQKTRHIADMLLKPVIFKGLHGCNDDIRKWHTTEILRIPRNVLVSEVERKTGRFR